MVACIDDIKTRIETVKNKTDNYESKINMYLDAVNIVKKMIDGVTSDIDNLVEELYEFFNKNMTLEMYLELKPNMESLCTAALKLYVRVRKSVLYPGFKTSVKEFHSSIDGIKEIIHDLDLFLIKLPNNQRFQLLSEKLNKIFE